MTQRSNPTQTAIAARLRGGDTHLPVALTSALLLLVLLITVLPGAGMGFV